MLSHLSQLGQFGHLSDFLHFMSSQVILSYIKTFKVNLDYPKSSMSRTRQVLSLFFSFLACELNKEIID